MLKLAADENFNGKIVRGLLRRNPHIDIIHIRDTEIYQADDPIVLEWAAQERRILLRHKRSHHLSLCRRTGCCRSANAGRVSGSRPVIEDLVLLVECSLEGEWDGRIQFLPL
jgi:hypothetical protein